MLSKPLLTLFNKKAILQDDFFVFISFRNRLERCYQDITY